MNYFFPDNEDDSEATDTDETINNPLEETLVYIFRDLNSQSAQEFAVKVLRELRGMIHSQEQNDN